MLRVLTCVLQLLVGGLLFPALAVAQLPPGSLERLKSASVYIENHHKDEVASGSGFVIQRDGNSAVIATNYHVAKPVSRYPGHWKLEVFFDSGTPRQFSAEATLLAANYADDLALLAVNHEGLPEPLPIDTGVQAAETQRVYIAGFPFGEMLGVAGQKPSLTITEGSISSVRRGRFGEPSLIQLSGGIDPGNSGGPIIDREGKLIAISVAKINQSSIGFGIPFWKLRELQQPIMRNPKVTCAPESSYLACQANLNPPAGMDVQTAMHNHHLLAFRQTENQPMPTIFKDQAWNELPRHGEARRCRSGGKDDSDAWVRLTAHMPLEHIVGTGPVFVLQWRSTLADGSYLFSRPYVFTEQELLHPTPVTTAKNEMPDHGANKQASARAGSAVDEIVRQTVPTVQQTVHRLGHRIRRVIRAGDNRYLVVYTADGKLRCIDMNTDEVVATRDAPKIDVLASGRTEVIGFNRTERNLTRYALPSLEPSGTRALQDQAAVRYARRGSGSSGPVVAVIQRSGAQKLACTQIDPRTGRLNRFAIDGEKGGRGKAALSIFDEMPISDDFRVRMSDDGSMITMWISGNSRVGTHVLSKYRNRWKYARLPKLEGYAVPGPSGALLCTADAVLAADLTELHQTPINLPTTSEDYFMTVGDVVKPTSGRSGLYTWQLASCSQATVHRTILLDGDLADHSVNGDDPGFVPIDERFQCLPQWNRLIVVPPGPSLELRLIELGEPLPDVSSLRESQTQTDSIREPVMRTWNARQGSYQVEAKLVATAKGYVKLLKKEGGEIVVPIAKLSQADQDYLQATKP